MQKSKYKKESITNTGNMTKAGKQLKLMRFLANTNMIYGNIVETRACMCGPIH